MIGKAEGCSPGRQKAVHQEGRRLFTRKAEGCSFIGMAGGCSYFYIGKAEGCSPCNRKLSRDLERRKASLPYMEGGHVL